jgi:hypothetical protein
VHKPLILMRNQGFFVFDYQNNSQMKFDGLILKILVLFRCGQGMKRCSWF